MYIPNAPPQPTSRGLHSTTSISEENAITLTPDAKSKRVRRQKKNSKYKITEWAENNSGISQSESNINTAKVLRDLGNTDGLSSGVKDLRLNENSSRRYKSDRRQLIVEQPPNTSKLAKTKIENSEVLQTMINETAAKAVNIEYDRKMYDEDYLIAVEDPDGEEAVIEAARQRRLDMAPIIVIPPKPEAKIGEPYVYSILPQDALSYSTPSFRNNYVVTPKNKCISCSTEDSAFVLARTQLLWQSNVTADL